MYSFIIKEVLSFRAAPLSALILSCARLANHHLGGGGVATDDDVDQIHALRHTGAVDGVEVFAFGNITQVTVENQAAAEVIDTHDSIASDLGIELEAGTYFLAWGLTGDSELYGPYGIPVTIAGQAATGDALQYDGAGWWRELYMDQNYNCPAGAAFLMLGTTNTPTDVSENALDIAVYPTVTRSSVRIEAKELCGVAVTDMLGRKLFETSPRTDAYDLDLSAYQEGLYMVRITTANGVGTRRIRLVR